MGFGRNGLRVAKTPTRSAPPSRGGRSRAGDVGGASARFAVLETPQQPQVREAVDPGNGAVQRVFRFEHDASLQMWGKEAVARDAEFLRQIGMYVSDRFHARYCIAVRCARPRRSPKVLRHLRWNLPAFTTMKVSNTASAPRSAKEAFMADSKRLLADALTGLMECKPLDQVRVAEIASAAGVSKQTFYHHFSDKYHLMEYCFRDMFAAPFERMGTLAPFDECYIEFLQQCHQRKTFLRNAFTSQDVNSLYRVMHRALRDAFGARVRVHGVPDEGETGFCLDFFSKGCAGCTRHWFDQGMDFEDAELVGLIRQCIPVGAARYFE